MIRIAVCDDQPAFAEKIQEMLLEEARENREAVKVHTYTDSGQLLYDLQEGAFYDLFFLDIEMPGTSGMELAAALRECLPEALTVFITSHREYALKAFELSVFRYIPKSEMETTLLQALRDAVVLIRSHCQACYIAESSKMLKRIPIDNILYVYKQEKNSIIVTKKEKISIRKSLGQMLGELKALCPTSGGERFLMTERGYIVNLYHVECLEDGSLLLDNGEVLPVSRSHMREAREAVIRFWEGIL